MRMSGAGVRPSHQAIQPVYFFPAYVSGTSSWRSVASSAASFRARCRRAWYSSLKILPAHCAMNPWQSLSIVAASLNPPSG